MNTNILKTRYEMKRQKLAHEGIFYFFSNITKKKNQQDQRRLIKIKTIKLRTYWVHF